MNLQNVTCFVAYKEDDDLWGLQVYFTTDGDDQIVLIDNCELKEDALGIARDIVAGEFDIETKQRVTKVNLDPNIRYKVSCVDG